MDPFSYQNGFQYPYILPSTMRPNSGEYFRAPLNDSPARHWQVFSRIWRVKIAYLLASLASKVIQLITSDTKLIKLTLNFDNNFFFIDALASGFQIWPVMIHVYWPGGQCTYFP